ncbi:metal ABC transporter solute-binding protein, Zn/Mn family [Bacillus sp. FJAT-45066]|uniref:metal ABC transporter solute-binding protein, Zn/Mn family n=1 Tax=Bacillus sp. FJAT-45066 TaxID=2011010 RepID=UPI000BB8375D|nr:zinc ABC transporter substrate-binding protein [Bacillus sp. FJAT-45066]
MKIKATLSILLLLLFTFLVGCNNEQIASEEEKLKIYTTIYPLEDFAKKIGGEHVVVESVYPPGADAHTYEPTTRMMSNIATADAFIYSGLGVEGFADKANEVLKNESVIIVAAAAGIDLLDYDHDDHDHGHEDDDHDHAHDEDHKHEDEDHDHGHDDDHKNEDDDHDHGHDDEHKNEDDDHDHGHDDDHKNEDDDHDHGHDDEHKNKDDDHDHGHDDEHKNEDDDHNHGDEDPHVWIDPVLAIQLAENIKNALVELKPEAKEDFEANFAKVKEDLEALHHEFEEMVMEASTNKILVNHAAFGYWEERYGIKQISVTGLSPTQEPSQRQLVDIVNTAKENNIKYVIFDQNITGNIAEIVRNEIGAEALVLHNLEAVTQEDVDNNEDYFSLMKRNIETLKKALN